MKDNKQENPEQNKPFSWDTAIFRSYDEIEAQRRMAQNAKERASYNTMQDQGINLDAIPADGLLNQAKTSSIYDGNTSKKTVSDYIEKVMKATKPSVRRGGTQAVDPESYTRFNVGGNNYYQTAGIDPFPVFKDDIEAPTFEEYKSKLKDSTPKIEVKYAYKLVLGNNGVNYQYLQYPEDTQLSLDEMKDIASRGSSKDIRWFGQIPNSPKQKEVKLNSFDSKMLGIGRKGKPGFNAPRAANIVSITPEEFLEKSKLYYKRTSTEEYNNLCNLQPNHSTDSWRHTINQLPDGSGTCLAGIMMSVHPDFIPGATQQDRPYVMTTGRFTYGINTAECIIVTTNWMSPTILTNNSIPKVVNIPYGRLQVIRERDYTQSMFYVKIKRTDESIKLFGAKVFRNKQLDRVVCFNDFYSTFNYTNPKFDGEKHIINIKEAGGKWSKWCLEDLDFYILDDNALRGVGIKTPKAKKVIKKGSSVKIINDKRLSLFKKGDIVKVTTLTKNSSNASNSRCLVTNQNGETELVLLKQLRFYDLNPQKKESGSKTSSQSTLNIPINEFEKTINEPENKKFSPRTGREIIDENIYRYLVKDAAGKISWESKNDFDF